MRTMPVRHAHPSGAVPEDDQILAENTNCLGHLANSSDKQTGCHERHMYSPVGVLDGLRRSDRILV